MNPMALPKPLEDAFQELERRTREACGKIDEAAKVLDESGDEIAESLDFDDPSVVRRVDDLKRTSRVARSTMPLALGTPAEGQATPVPSSPPRPIRPPRRPPTRG